MGIMMDDYSHQVGSVKLAICNTDCIVFSIERLSNPGNHFTTISHVHLHPKPDGNEFYKFTVTGLGHKNNVSTKYRYTFRYKYDFSESGTAISEGTWFRIKQGHGTTTAGEDKGTWTSST